MSIEALLERLGRDAEAQARALEAEAQARARALEAAGLAERTQLLEREMSRVEAEARDAVARETAQAEHTHRLRRLEEGAGVLELVFGRAEEMLRDAPAASYQDGLAGLLDETLRYTAGAVRLRVPADAAGTLETLVGENSRVALLAEPGAAAGILCESADGRVRVDNTLVARLRQRLDDLAPALLAQIEER